jgi:hypothetical protein
LLEKRHPGMRGSLGPNEGASEAWIPVI